MARKVFHTHHVKNNIYNMIEHIYKKFIKNKIKNFEIFCTIVAVIFIRRGLRGLMDIYLFPNHGVISMIVSIILGLTILSVDGKGLEEIK